MTTAASIASFVRAQIAQAMVPTTAVGTVTGSPQDIIPSSRLLVAVDGSSLAAPVKRLANLVLRTGDRVVLQKWGADWYVVGRAVDPVVDQPLGVIARAARSTNSSTTTSELGVLRLDNVPIMNGHLYKIWTSPLFVVGTQTGDVNAVMLRANTAGVATTSSGQLTQIQHQVANTNHPPVESSIVLPYVASADGDLSVLLSVSRGSGGTGNASLATASNAIPMHLVVEHMGLDVGDTGVVL